MRKLGTNNGGHTIILLKKIVKRTPEGTRVPYNLLFIKRSCLWYFEKYLHTIKKLYLRKTRKHDALLPILLSYK